MVLELRDRPIGAAAIEPYRVSTPLLFVAALAVGAEDPDGMVPAEPR